MFYGNTYDTHTCQNKLYKDIATSITGNTYTNTNYDIKYLHDIAETVYDGSLTGNTMNYYLRIISENISVVQYDTDLEWLVRPTNIVYGDNFNATGLLTTDGVPIAGETVKLLIGDTVVGSVVTDNSGNASFSGDSHVHTGTHSFKLVYSGSNQYKSSDTGNATVTIDKETSYLNLPSNSTLYTDGSMTVSGSLLDNDPNPIIGKEVTLTDGTNTFTATSGNDGKFSFDLSTLSIGTHSLTATFVDGDYSGNTENISVVVADPYVVVSADKSILSYADRDSAIVSATVYSGVDYSGETVTFYYDGNVLGTGTVEEGVADCTTPYGSQGIGDIVLSAEINGISLIQTYSIQDIYKYIPCTSDTDEFYFSGGNHSYSSDGLRLYGATSEKQVLCKTPIVNPMEISYVFNGNGNTQSSAQPLITFRGSQTLDGTARYNNSYWGGINGTNSSNPNSAYYSNPSNYDAISISNVHLTVGDIIKIQINSNTISFYLNDNLLYTVTYTFGSLLKYFGWYLNNGRDWIIKDFKMKQL